MVETTIAVVLVGGLYIVALNLVGASQVTQARYSDREQGAILAEALLDEGLAMPYDDPQDGGTTFGVEPDETATPRSNLDDLDDLNGWSSTPPVDADGNAIPGADRYTRTVAVEWVELAAPKNTAGSDTGLKRITVTVTVGSKTVARLAGFKAAAWPAAQDLVEPY